MAKENIGHGFSVCCINKHTNEWNFLYDCIDTLEEAYLLAQYSMGKHRKDVANELIVIFPGWNIGIEDKPALYKEAEILSAEYASERCNE